MELIIIILKKFKIIKLGRINFVDKKKIILLNISIKNNNFKFQHLHNVVDEKYGRRINLN